MVLSLLSLFVGVGVVAAQNNDLVVMVHGLASDASTWEYIPEIEASGLDVIAVDLNPFESNYDRAVDLYAQLKGVQMDYGVCHSAQTGHARFGRDYTGIGLYPEWGPQNKIHFVGHSMGGLTIRYLEKFLEVGNDCAQDTDDLFQGGNNWITSIVALATPFDGTTFLEQIPFGANDLFFSLFATFSTSDVEFLSMPQWGLEPRNGESVSGFINRVEDAGLFDNEDFSIFDLSPDGAAAFNNANAQVYRSDRYYFSYAAERTSSDRQCTFFFFNCRTVQNPDSGMSFILSISANIIGDQDNIADQANDGIVNQVRARCPGNVNCRDVNDRTNINWTPGEWNVMSIGYLDHFQLTERDTSNDNNNYPQSARRLFLELGSRLKALDSGSTSLARTAISEEENYIRSEKAKDTTKYINLMGQFADTLGESNTAGVSTVGVVFLVLGSVLAVAIVGVVAVKKKKSMKTKQDLLNLYPDADVE